MTRKHTLAERLSVRLPTHPGGGQTDVQEKHTLAERPSVRLFKGS